MNRIKLIVAVLLLTLGLASCVVVPAGRGPYYGRGHYYHHYHGHYHGHGYGHYHGRDRW